MKSFKIILLSCLSMTFIAFQGLAQNVTIEGYVFEDNNRGYLNDARITVLERGFEKATASTDLQGKFVVEVPADGDYVVKVKKNAFEPAQEEISTKGKSEGETVYTKIALTRSPGYIFEATIAELSYSGESAALDSVRIEIYNNTKEREELSIDANPNHLFNFIFEQGNHYTLLLRKEGYFAKRIEANVNVNGCLLCFEGLGRVTPGVSDNLTLDGGFKQGTLGSNIDMKPIEVGRSIKIENIYYDYNKSDIRPDAAIELDKLVNVMKSNPHLEIELGSHTDSRGSDTYNQKLSQQRAKAAVDYVISQGIPSNTISARGYGESRLVNSCKNGVTCSDAKHEQNRRTEFTVIGVIKSDMDNRPLREIIMDEKLAMGSFGTGDVLVIPPGANPKDYMGGGAAPKSDNVPNALPSDSGMSGGNLENHDGVLVIPPGGEVPDFIKKQAEQANKQPVKTPTIETTPEVETPAPPSSGNMGAEVPGPPPTSVEDIEEHFAETPPPSPKESKMELAPEKTIEDKMSEIESAVKENSGFVPSTKSLPSGYSGYRVEFFRSASPLPKSHIIFKQFGNITMEETQDGAYSYMLGEFKKENSAEDYRQTILVKRFPKSKVIQYDKGRRLN